MLTDTINIAAAAVTAATKPEAELIASLKSNAPLKEKADACRELAHVGTKDAVSSLAALLPDDQLSHMARYGLETIPDPSVDDALREALGLVKGKLLAGVIGSIGVRRDTKATEALAKLLNDGDAAVAQAAARALGRLGTVNAAEALCQAVGSVSKENQLDFCEGLLRCAEGLKAAGLGDEAKKIYNCLRNLPDTPHQVRSAVLIGG